MHYRRVEITAGKEHVIPCARSKKKMSQRGIFFLERTMEESDPRGLGDLTLRLASESEGRAEVGPLSGAQEQSSVALYGRFPSPAPRK